MQPRRRPLPAALLFLVVSHALVWAQHGAAASASFEPEAYATPADQTAQPEKQSELVAVKGYTLPPEKLEKAVDYARARDSLYFLGFAYGLLVLLLVLRWRLAPRCRDWAERISSRRIVQEMVYAPLVLLTLSALNLPRSAYAHWLGVKFGLSVQGWPSWFWDWSKGRLIGLTAATFLLWILYSFIRRSRRWWFYFWLATLPLAAFVVLLEPLLVDPLFYKFEPLAARQPDLAREIETVVRRGGLEIPPERLFEMKASEKLTAVNAYVTGIGASKRVVVWDTTLAKLTRPQVLAVFGHEMGHYVLGHIPQGMALFAAALLVFLYLGDRLARRVLARWGARWGIRGLDDWASLPVLLLLAALFNFGAAPASNAISRYIEQQADTYGLEVTHGILPHAGEASAEAHQILGEINLEEPHPPAFIRFWRYSHPPTNDRIVFARTYNPWSPGRSPRFIK